MNKYFDKMHGWFRERSPRERVFFFFLGLILIYFLFSIVFLKPISNEKKELRDNINSLNTEINAQSQQIALITAEIKNGTLLTSIKQLNAISKNLKEINSQLNQLKPIMSSTVDSANISKMILNLQFTHVTLSSIKDFPSVPWVIDVKNQADLTNIDTTNIMQHDFQVGLRSDYFNTIEYLKLLEKISANIYWDNLDYKVIQYPEASIVVKFHLLMNQTS